MSSEIDDDVVAAALSEFDAVWDALRSTEKARVLELLIKRVDHDGERGSMSITFHSTGIKTLVNEMAEKEAA